MIVYRIVKNKKRTRDLPGAGAFNEGGRWNNEGTYALYTSENPSLALLKVLVYVDESELPPQLFIITLEINETAPILTIPDSSLPKDWRFSENIKIKDKGDRIFQENKYLGIKAPSAILPSQYNYILNPRFPGYHNYLKVVKVEMLEVDKRLG